MEQRITIDTHTLVWYLYKPSRRYLSTRALEAIESAENNGIIYIPVIVLLEVLRLIEKGKFPLPFNELLSWLEQNDSYEVIPVDTVLVRIAVNLQRLELHDRLIVATAALTNTRLVSCDREIKANGIDVIW